MESSYKYWKFRKLAHAYAVSEEPVSQLNYPCLETISYSVNLKGTGGCWTNTPPLRNMCIWEAAQHTIGDSFTVKGSYPNSQLGWNTMILDHGSLSFSLCCLLFKASWQTLCTPASIVGVGTKQGYALVTNLTGLSQWQTYMNRRRG